MANMMPLSPPIPGVPVNPDARMDEVILSPADVAFFSALTDERIEEILAAETEGDLDPDA